MENLRVFWKKSVLPRNKPLLGILTLLVFLVLWELAPVLGIANTFFTSSPSRIWRAAEWLFAHGLWEDIGVSLVEFSTGMALAIVSGILIGLALGWYRTLNAMFEPFITFLNATPRVAIFPLIILWLGIGIYSKAAIVYLGAFFPIAITVMKGIRTIDETLLKCARSFGASNRQIFTTLALPSCVPYIFAGLHIAVGRGLVGVVIGELVAAQAGVGHMMSRAAASFQTDKVFVGLFLLAGFGYFLTAVITLMEKRFEFWRS